MKLVSFIKGLLPRLDKDALLEDIQITKTELSTGVIPTYDAAQTHFRTSKISSKKAKDYQNIFYRNLNIKSHKKLDSMVADIHELMKNVYTNLQTVEMQVEDLFTKDIIKEGLSARKALLIRAVDSITFITKFSVDLLNIVYIYEAEHKGADIQEGFGVSRKSESLVDEKMFIFSKLLAIYGQKKDDFDALFVKVPEVILNDTTIQGLTAIYKEEDIDPINSQYIQQFNGNPIFHLRMAIAEWQASRYRAFSDKKKMLELRLLDLKLRNEGQSDPGAEREIKYIQERIEKLEYKMQRMID